MSQTLNQSMSQIITSATTLIGVLIMMFSINWIMTLVALLIVPVSLGLISIVVKKSQRYFKSQQEYLGHVNGQVEEVYSGHNIVKAFNAEEREINTFNDLNDTLYKSAWKSQFLSGLMQPIMMFVGNLGYVLVSIIGGFLAIKGAIEVGDIQAFIQYVRSFTQPIAQTAQIANVLQSTAAAAERVFEFLDEEEEVKDVENPISTKDIVGEVEFNHVHFGYNPEKIIINDFTAKVKPGDEITRESLRKMVAMVLQDTYLFSETVSENIRYGRLDASDEEVKRAAKAAHVDSFIKTLPDGYNMELNEEASNVSQGQKQLLTIARAILADPKILILDEATSSVDTRTELLIQKAMDKLMEGRTSFIIAHRLSTIRDADLILVMKDGDIIEQGNHHELLKKGGFYASLYNSQFENA